MIIVGDIGNTETKICLVNSNNTIIKKITLITKKINSSLLKRSLSNLNLKNNTKVLFLFLRQVFSKGETMNSDRRKIYFMC